MKRRNFIQAGIAGVTIGTGCVQSTDQSSDNTEAEFNNRNPGTNATPRPHTSTYNSEDATIGIPRRISVIDVDVVPKKYEAELTAEMVEESVTQEHTASVRITLTNEATEKRIFYPDAAQAPFAGRMASTPRGLLLFADSRFGRALTNCWKPDFDGPLDYSMRTAVAPLEPGETIGQEIEIWDDYRESGCMLVGTYRFVQSYAIAEDRNATTNEGTTTGVDDEETLGMFEWGFTVEVSER